MSMNQKHNIPVSAKDNPTEYHRLYRIANKDRIKKYNEFRKTRVRDRVRDRKKALIDYKGGVCQCCGRKHDGENSCIFDFHHAGDKEFNLAPLTRTWDVLMKEVDKCMLVCATCHRLIHKDG